MSASSTGGQSPRSINAPGQGLTFTALYLLPRRFLFHFNPSWSAALATTCVSSNPCGEPETTNHETSNKRAVRSLLPESLFLGARPFREITSPAIKPDERRGRSLHRANARRFSSARGCILFYDRRKNCGIPNDGNYLGRLLPASSTEVR